MVTSPFSIRMPLADRCKKTNSSTGISVPVPHEIDSMLETVGVSIAGRTDRIDRSGESILLDQELRSAATSSEAETLDKIYQYAAETEVMKSMIGMGYYGTHVPAGDRPKRAGKSGLVHRLHALPGRNCPRPAGIAADVSADDHGLDRDGDGQRLAARRSDGRRRSHGAVQTSGQTRSQAERSLWPTMFIRKPWMSFKRGPSTLVLRLSSARSRRSGPLEIFGALLQYPGTTGEIRDLTDAIDSIHRKNALVAVATDLLSLALLKPPGEMGADIVLGSAQRFGVPMGFGGPHAAFFATRDEYKRSAPGRIIGVSKDRAGQSRVADGNADPRTTHSPRQSDVEYLHRASAVGQHGRILRRLSRSRRNSNDCRAGAYTCLPALAERLKDLGFPVEHHGNFFDTLRIATDRAESKSSIVRLELGMNLRRYDDGLGISLDETTTLADINLLLHVFAGDQEVDRSQLTKRLC